MTKPPLVFRKLQLPLLLLFAFAFAFALGCGGGSSKEPASSAEARPMAIGGQAAMRSREGGETDNDVSEVRRAPQREEKPMDAPRADMNARGPAPAQQPPPPPPPPLANPSPGGQPSSAVAPVEDKRDTQLIIYTARVTMAVYQVEQGLLSVEKIARDMGGYLSLKRDREIVIRIPRARFEPALAAIDKVGDVLHRDIQAQDVTDEFVDTEIRIKNARAMQVRLRTLLERAAVKEALEIEKELARVTQELELLEGKLKMLKDKIAYSTITVMFEARGAAIQATRIRLPFPWLSQLGLPSLLSLDEVK